MIKQGVKEIVDGEAILEQALKAFGIEHGMQTNPEIIQGVLKEMKLNDLHTSFLPMKEFLVKATSKPQDFEPLIENIKQAIIHKHPAIIEFLELALLKDWLEKSEHIYRAAHSIYLLEHVTAAMCNNYEFFCEVHDHLKGKERLYGIDSRYLVRSFFRALRISHNLFETIKAFSVDPGMTYIRLGRGSKAITKFTIQDLYVQNKLNYIEFKLLSSLTKKGPMRLFELIKLNIYEAGISEFEHGRKINSISAFELNENISVNPPRVVFVKKEVIPEHAQDDFYDLIVRSENLFPSLTLSQRWASLYTSWNMAFVLGELDNLDIVFPKLLIPSLIDVKSENFFGVRCISLWLTINTFFFRQYSGTQHVPGPSNKNEMAQAWARINKRYAVGLAKREVNESSQTLMRHYRQFFSRPIRNFLRLLKHFLT